MSYVLITAVVGATTAFCDLDEVEFQFNRFAEQEGRVLWSHRGGDANMRSAWICTRNDVVGNLAVLMAALGVFGTGTGWPDILVAGIMAGLALQGAFIVVRHAWGELYSTVEHAGRSYELSGSSLRQK